MSSVVDCCQQDIVQHHRMLTTTTVHSRVVTPPLAVTTPATAASVRAVMGARRTLQRWISHEQGTPELLRWGTYPSPHATPPLELAATPSPLAATPGSSRSDASGDSDDGDIFTVNLEYRYPMLDTGGSPAESDMRRRLKGHSSVFVVLEFDRENPDARAPRLRIVAPRVVGPSLFQGVVCAGELASGTWRLSRTLDLLLSLRSHIGTLCEVQSGERFTAAEQSHGQMHIAASHPDWELKTDGVDPTAIKKGAKLMDQAKTLLLRAAETQQALERALARDAMEVELPHSMIPPVYPIGFLSDSDDDKAEELSTELEQQQAAALALCEEAARLVPCATYSGQCGVILFNMRRFADAHRAFCDACDRLDDNVNRFNRANASYMGGEIDRALEEIKTVQRHPHAEGLFVALGNHLRAKLAVGDVVERPAKALPLLRRVCELDPHQGSHFNELGVCLQALGHRHEAAAAFTHALELGAGAQQAFHRPRDLGMSVHGAATTFGNRGLSFLQLGAGALIWGRSLPNPDDTPSAPHSPTSPTPVAPAAAADTDGDADPDAVPPRPLALDFGLLVRCVADSNEAIARASAVEAWGPPDGPPIAPAALVSTRLNRNLAYENLQLFSGVNAHGAEPPPGWLFDERFRTVLPPHVPALLVRLGEAASARRRASGLTSLGLLQSDQVLIEHWTERLLPELLARGRAFDSRTPPEVVGWAVYTHAAFQRLRDRALDEVVDALQPTLAALARDAQRADFIRRAANTAHAVGNTSEWATQLRQIVPADGIPTRFGAGGDDDAPPTPNWVPPDHSPRWDPVLGPAAVTIALPDNHTLAEPDEEPVWSHNENDLMAFGMACFTQGKLPQAAHVFHACIGRRLEDFPKTVATRAAAAKATRRRLFLEHAERHRQSAGSLPPLRLPEKDEELLAPVPEDVAKCVTNLLHTMAAMGQRHAARTFAEVHRDVLLRLTAHGRIVLQHMDAATH